MSTVCRLKAAGAILALITAVTCSQVWGDPAGRGRRSTKIDDAIRTLKPADAADDLPGGKFARQPVVTYQALDGDLHFALQLQPKLPAPAPRPLDVLVVVDTAASQAGAPLKRARQITEQLVKDAGANDRVAVWTINTPDATRDLSGGLQAKDSAKLADALTTLEKVEYASGAVDLKDGLKKALRTFETRPERQAVVLFLGRGESALAPLSDADRVELAQDMVSRQVEFFPVPVGLRVHPINLHGLACATGGALVRMDPSEKPADFVKRLHESLVAPVLYPTKALFSADVTQLLPTRLPPLRGDVPTLVAGRMKPADALAWKVEGTVAGRAVVAEASETVTPPEMTNYFLVSLVNQWSNADKSAPARMRADRGLAQEFERVRLAHDEFLNDAHWALSQNNWGAAEKLFQSARKIDPRDVEATAGLKVVEKLKTGKISRAQLRETLNDTKAIGTRFEKGGDVQVVKARVQELAQEPAPTLPPAAGAPANPPVEAGNLIDLERRRRAVQEQQLSQLVEDTIRRARELINSDPDTAYDLLKRQLGSVRENTDLTDAVRATLAGRLESAMRTTQQQGIIVKQNQEEALRARIQADARAAAFSRQQGEQERIRERVRSFSALMNQARYEEAYKEALVLQQEQISKGAPVPVQATAAYTMGLNSANLREFEDLRRIKEDRYMLTLLQVERSHVPFPDEPPVAFPPASTWKQITDLRKDKYTSDGLGGDQNSGKTKELRDKLNKTVNIEKAIDNAPLRDVIEFLSDKYELTILVDTQAFDQQGQKAVEDAPVKLPKMPGVTLSTVLRLLLSQVNGTYLIRRDYIEITTGDRAIAEKAVRAYPVADLVIPIPNGINNQSLNQNLQVLGSSLSAAGQAIFGAVGGGLNVGNFGALGIGGVGGLGVGGLGIGGLGIGGALGAGGLGGAIGALGVGGAAQAGFQGNLGFAGGNNQTNLGFGGGTLGFGGGQQGQFGNLGGQFGLQGGDTSAILIELIQDVIAPKEWEKRAARYLFNNTLVKPGEEESTPILNPDLLNSLGYYQPARALVVRATSRIQTRLGGGLQIKGGGGAAAAAADPAAKPGMLAFGPGAKDRNAGGVAVAKADAKPAAQPKPQPAAEAVAVAKKDHDPKAAWQDAMAKGQFKPRQVIATADILGHFDKFDEAAELLKADLRQGVMVHPCVFEALALALQGSGGSLEEVERARVSVLDLEPRSPLGYLQAAKAMDELGKPERAVAFCKQAAALEPNQPDPYVNTLVYLQKQSDVDTDAMQWAADNLLRREWAVDGAVQQASARQRLQELANKLSAAGRQADARRVLAAVSGQAQRDLEIEVTWADQADLDLKVTEPSGTVCSPRQRMTTGGGAWAGDHLGPNANRETYAAAEAFPGVYEVQVERVWGKPLGNKATVKVTKFKGTDRQTQELHTLALDSQGQAFLRVELDGGRRTSATSVPPSAMAVRTVKKAQREDPDRVFNILRSMADPVFASGGNRMKGGTSAAGTMTDALGDTPDTESVAEMNRQTKVASALASGVEMTQQTQVSADGRSLKVSLAPVFQAVSAGDVGVNLPTVPGGR
jgi:tetratricopeptide (TPR) repeat protein